MFDALRGLWDRGKASSRALVRSAFLLATLGALGGCAHAFEVAPGYSIKEIPYAGSPFYWIDNESVLFNGNHRASADDSVYGSNWDPPALYKWNTRTGQITELMKTGRYAHLCYDRGYLYISFDRNGDRVVRRGAIGAQVETVVKKEAEKLPFPGKFNRYSCRWEELPEATQSDRGVVTVLRDDHGFIEAERPWDPFPQRQYFLVLPNGIPRPIDFHGGNGAPSYSAYKSAYAVKESIGVWDTRVGFKYWLVHPTGLVETMKIPPGEWQSGTVYAMPTRNGWFMSSLAMKNKAAGGYLLDHGAVTLILNALIGAFSVSPNGCLVAMAARPFGDHVSRVAVLDVCPNR